MKKQATIPYYEIEQETVDYTAKEFKYSGLHYNTKTTEWLLVDKANKIVLGLGFSNSIVGHDLGHLFTITDIPKVQEPVTKSTAKNMVVQNNGYVSENFALKMLAIVKGSKIEIEI